MFLFSANSACVQVVQVAALGSVLLASSGFTDAFAPPTAFTNTRPSNNQPIVAFPTDPRYHHPATLRHAIPFPYDSIPNVEALSTATGLILSDDAQAVAATTPSLAALRTVLVALAALVVGGGVLAFATAAFVMPKAAARLEEDTKRMRPELWAEYQAKLGPGETMTVRPDLLQELGEIMRPIVIADYEASARVGGAGADAGSSKSGVEPPVAKTDRQKAAEGGGVDQWND